MSLFEHASTHDNKTRWYLNFIRIHDAQVSASNLISKRERGPDSAGFGVVPVLARTAVRSIESTACNRTGPHYCCAAGQRSMAERYHPQQITETVVHSEANSAAQCGCGPIVDSWSKTMGGQENGYHTWLWHVALCCGTKCLPRPTFSALFRTFF